jgi:anhydro-N-acetylmuramic acid kinase
MGKIYTALGLMSGTSMDGIDASVIRSDGNEEFTNIIDDYCEFDKKLQERLVNIRNSIATKANLIDFSKELKNLERDITIFHSEVVNNISQKINENIDLVGFHGQTIFHDPQNKISKQLGDGNLLSQLTKKTVIYDFRQKDLDNGGQGAPLTPIFHKLISAKIYEKTKIKFINILNIGGISNITSIEKIGNFSEKKIEAYDIGPGNCLIDKWIRKNSNKRFDEDGLIAKSGKVNEIILNQAIENFNLNSYSKSLDINDFDISFVRGLSIEDGCATITKFTAYLISEGIKFISKKNNQTNEKYIICGGGRKNKFLIKNIKEYLGDVKNITLDFIDTYGYDGDFVESNAFGYLAVRSILKLPLTFPSTTRCIKPTTGGKIVKNF